MTSTFPEGLEQAGPDAQFWAFLKEGKFMIQHSPSANEYVFYPRVVAPKSGATDLEWVEASGKGTVYAVTQIARKPDYGGNYNIAIVELDEGPRMTTRVVDIDPAAVAIGMAVTAKVAVPDFGTHKDGDQPIILFQPA